MSKRKKETYTDMYKMMQEVQVKVEKEKKRMSSVLAEAVLTDEVALKLGSYSDTDLRKVMSYLMQNVDNCIKRLEFEKEKQGR